jgi:hypothetical protein
MVDLANGGRQIACGCLFLSWNEKMLCLVLHWRLVSLDGPNVVHYILVKCCTTPVPHHRISHRRHGVWLETEVQLSFPSMTCQRDEASV